jgi:hypothetical protein
MPTVMAYHDVKDKDHWLASQNPDFARHFVPSDWAAGLGHEAGWPV